MSETAIASFDVRCVISTVKAYSYLVETRHEKKRFGGKKKLSAFKNVFIARQLLHSSGFGDVGTGLNIFSRVISKLQHSCFTKFV